MANEKTKEESKEVKNRYVLTEVITQKEIAIQDSTNPEEVFTDKGLLLEILNKLDKIEKALV